MKQLSLVAPVLLASLAGCMTTQDAPDSTDAVTSEIIQNGWTIPNEFTASDSLVWYSGLSHLYVLTMRNDTKVGVSPAEHGFYAFMIGDGNLNKVWWVADTYKAHWYDEVQQKLENHVREASADAESMHTSGVSTGKGHPGPSPGGTPGGYVFSPGFRGWIQNLGTAELTFYQALTSDDPIKAGETPASLQNQWTTGAIMNEIPHELAQIAAH